MLRQYRSDASHVISLSEIEIQPDMTYKEEPIRILAREIKELRNKCIALVKVLWQCHRVKEATWEPKEVMRKYCNSIKSENRIKIEEPNIYSTGAYQPRAARPRPEGWGDEDLLHVIAEPLQSVVGATAQPFVYVGSVRGFARDPDILNCEHCGKKHRSECWKLTRARFRCGSQKNFARDCPRNDNVPSATPQRSAPTVRGRGNPRGGSVSRGGLRRGSKTSI
ncbi:receptor-like protein kinase [Gossypium australe]|uniref:Receptor-like protein kinase n=1 Tax=Gossypium australe TaxID=47621 RepID=A0A5B6WQI7_9ROSI|nr:receptor-like protein kinase [Gossypium australe]